MRVFRALKTLTRPLRAKRARPTGLRYSVNFLFRSADSSQGSEAVTLAANGRPKEARAAFLANVARVKDARALLHDVMRAHVEAKDVESAESLLEASLADTVPVEAKVEEVELLIEAFAGERNHKRASKWMGHAEDQGLKIRSRTFRKVLEACAGRGEYKAARFWLGLMEDHFDASQLESASISIADYNELEDAYNLMVQACAKGGQEMHTKDWFRSMMHLKLVPKTETLNNVLKMLLSMGKTRTANGVLERALACGTVPNHDTYGVMWKGSIQAEDFKRAHEIMQQAAVFGLATDAQYRQVMDELRVRLNFDGVLEVYREYAKMQDLQHSSKTHRVALQAFTQESSRAEDGNIARVLEVFDGMKANGVLDVKHFNQAMHDFAKDGAIEQGLQIFQLMLDRRITPTEASCHIVLNMYTKEKLVDEALHFLSIMPKLGVDPTELHFTEAARTCAAAGRAEDAEIVIEKMEAIGLPLTIRAYRAVIRAFAEARDLEGAMRWYNELLIGEAAPPASINGSMLRAHLTCVGLDRALEWIARMQATRSDWCITYRGAAFLCEVMLSQARGEEAEKIVETLHIVDGPRQDGSEKADLYARFVRYYARAEGVGAMSKCNRWMEAAANAGAVSKELFHVVLSSAARSNDPKSAMKWLNKMRGSSVKPDAHAYRLVLRVCGEQYREIFTMMREDRVPIAIGEYEQALLSSGMATVGIMKEVMNGGQDGGPIPGVRFKTFNVAIETVKSLPRKKHAGVCKAQIHQLCKEQLKQLNAMWRVFRGDEGRRQDDGSDRETLTVARTRALDFIKRGQPARALDLLDKMRETQSEKDEFLSLNVYNEMLRGCVELGDAKNARIVVDTILSDGVMPDAYTFSIAAKPLARSGRPDKIFDLRQKLFGTDISWIDLFSQNLVIAAVERNADMERQAKEEVVRQILGEMAAMNIKPDSFTQGQINSITGPERAALLYKEYF